MRFKSIINQVFKYYNKIIFVLLTCLFLISFSGYSQDLNFKHININNGLSQNAVFAILKDSKGFMWFGTKDGLNKFDGYNFVIYQHNPFDSTTLSANYITSLYEDKRGLIWVGTYDGGVNAFDRKFETFYRVDLRKDSVSLRNVYEIKTIAEDLEGNIWVGTSGDGLFRIKTNVDNDHFVFSTQRFYNDPENKNSIGNNQVLSISSDKKGFLWLGTSNGLNRMDLKTNTFTQYNINTKNPAADEVSTSYSINSVFETKNGTLWVGTLGGLVKFNRTDGSYIYYPHKYDLFRYGWGNITAIDEDSKGNLWIATPGELMNFNTQKETYSSFVHDPFDPKTISFNSVSTVYIDNTDMLWVGTTGMGIDYYDPSANRFKIFSFTPDKKSRTGSFSVRSILEDNSGDVWIGAEVLYKWERKTDKIISFEKSSNEPTAFGNTIIFSMIQCYNGDIWAATTEGLFRYNPKSGEQKLYIFKADQKNGLPQQEVYTVFQDLDSVIWIATEKYLCKLTDSEKGTFHSISYHSASTFYEQVRPVIFQDANREMWLGTKYGLLLFNPVNETFKLFENHPDQPNSINNNLIKSICADPIYPDRYLWIGTNGGLNRYDRETNSFFYYTEENGLPNNVIYGILPDEQNNLWLSTNKGLSRFNLQSGEFRNFDVNDGLQSNEFNTGAFFKSRQGEIFFGGIKGLNYFFPDQITENKNMPPVVLTKIKLAEESLSVKRNPDLLEKSVGETQKITLSHKEDIVTFEFAALEYSAPEKNQYEYMLENFNDKWINTGGLRSVTYTHLPPGDYIFRVKASNNDGVWNSEGLALEVVVTPPWYRTWLALIIFGLGFTFVILLIRRYEMARINLKNQLEFEKISTDSLRHIAQMKSQFFANISHEFRTPLTLILGQVDSVMSSGINNSEKSKLQVANRNARRLLKLINQLLDLSKLETGKMELNSLQYNMVGFLKSLLFSFESMASSKKITLSFKSVSDHIAVVFDMDKMEKVFYNLIFNAIKYTSENGEIEVEIKTVDTIYIEISVSDNGSGIPEKYIPHIFNRFFQVESSSTRNYEGTGIGLALVKELVELHNGMVKVESSEGEGSTFTVKLPIGEISKVEQPAIIKISEPDNYSEILEAEIAVENEGYTVVKEMQNNDNREIVLVVEDNNDVRAFICDQLGNEYHIKQAENGENGLQIALETVPDLIITDLMMPKMNGLQLCKAIRNDERTSHIPVIMLTAKVGFDNKIEGLETGVDDYITKPFSSKELMVRVKNLINQRKLLRARFKTSTIIKPSEVSVLSIDQVFLDKIIQMIEANFENQDFTPELLASAVNMSVSQLNRKLNALINQPAGQLMRSLRLQRAADLLKQKAGTVSEICYQLDFNDPAYFSRAFKKQFGCSPSDFIKN
ncbi:MAG TPA: two-component regulator propeller domain-containing protein [Draconibacterium sp.]|nr:two-component regulator propeller domain-containing protein [Draconibacterium sp.]